jgi:AsmA protein
VKSLPKILLWAAAALAVLAIGAVAAVALLFDPKDYQPLLERTVRESTGRELKLQGELGLDFFPCCSVTLGRASLGNPPGFPEGEFVSVEGAALGIRVWPLIARREVVVGDVRLEGLDARLLVRGDGRGNWEFDRGEVAAEAAPTGRAEGGDVRSLDIAGVRVTGGRISYRDEQDASAYLVENLELETGAIAAGEPFDVRLGARVTEEAAKIVADVKLDATATVAADSGRLTLAKPALEVAASGAGLPAKGVTARLGAAELAVETAQDVKLAFRQLEGEFSAPGLEAVAGDVAGSFVAEEARVEIGGSTELVVPRLTADVTASGKEIPGETISAKIAAGDLGLDVDKMRGAVGTLTADVNGLGARLAVTGGGRVSDAGAELRGTLELDPVSPRSLLAVLREPEPKTADPEALTKLAGRADWALGKDSLELTKMDFALDRSRITGRVGFAPLGEAVTRFDVRVDAIDVDRYLEAEVAAEAAPTGGQGGSGEEDIPVETIRGLKLDGRVAVGQLVFDGLKLSEVAATVRASDGRLRLDPLAARLYGGEYRGSVAIDATGRTASVATEQSVSALQVGGFLKDLMQSDKLAGALTGRISARGTGNTTDALMRSLDGDVAVSLADGAYLGTDFWHEIRTARARLKREAPPPAPAEPRTPLEAAELAGKMTGGVLRTERMLAQIPFIRLTAAGALDLAALTMDLRTQARVIENPTFEDGTTLKDLKGLTIPVTLKGAMDVPDVSVDLKGLAASAATQKLLERLDKKLGGGEPALDGAATGTTVPPQEEKPRDALKRQLRDLLKPRE